MSDRFTISPEHAKTFLNWLDTRGGVYLWSSIDLSDPGWSQYSPAKTKEGEPYPKPHWKADPKPTHITDASQFDVVEPLEVKRFKVAIRGTSPFSLTFKCTTASSQKIHAHLDKVNLNRAEKDAWYAFDYESQECVIFVQKTKVPLSQYSPVGEPVAA